METMTPAPAQATPNTNTASQSLPRDIGAPTEERGVTAAPKDIVTAAQNSIEKAIAASSQLPIRILAAQKSQEVALTLGTRIQKPMEPTVKSPFQSNQPSQPLLMSQPINIKAAGNDSVNITLAHERAKYMSQHSAPTGQALNRRIVTPQGTWQNVAVPSQPQHVEPAVQDFLQKAFETVHRSNHTTMEAAKSPLQNAPTPTVVMLPHPPPFIPTPLSPQNTLMAPFPLPIQNPLKPRSASLPDTPYNMKLSMTKSTEASTSLAQTPTKSEIKKPSTSQTGATSKSQSYTGYTFYNSSRQNPNSAPKRSVLVAKRHNPEGKTSEVDSSVDTTSETLTAQEAASQQTPKAESSTVPEERTAEQTPSESPVKTTSRVADTFRQFRERKGNSSQSSQGPKKAQASAGAAGRNWRRPKINDDEEDIDPKRRVLVSGFPAYTQSHDLIRVLSAFGHCQVDCCRNRLAVVTFDREADAKCAMRATNDIVVYGEFIEIKPYTNPKHVQDLFKAYKKVIMTQKGDDITMPSNIDLSGDFAQQLENVQSAIRLTREQAQAVTNLYADLELVLQNEWPGCVAIPFGSIPTGLGIKSSDADCFVQLPAARERERGAGGAGGAGGAARGAGGAAAAFVARARRLLLGYPHVFSRVLAIPRANTPIVKFLHVPSGFHCDVNAKTPLGAQNSKLVKLLLEHDARLPHVAVLVKYWAKVHELSGTGRLTNYALTMMVVFYLQQPGVALVPPVERLQRDPASRYIVDHWNAGFSARELPGPPDAAPVHDLLGGFFRFYAGFDFERLVVCPYLGVAVPKAAFEAPHTLPPEFARYVGNVQENLASPIRYGSAYCVQDPFEQSHNVASSVCGKLAAEIGAYLQYAADAYAADRAAGCRNFLRTILLSRPKWRPERVSPFTTVPLVPRVRGHIAGPDWRGTLREIVLETIFAQILKLKLTEKEVKKTRGRRCKAIEKYSGSSTKPVWRRRKVHASREPPSETPEQFVSRQVTFTEEILAGPNEAVLEFEVELWFRDEPRNGCLGFRMVSGDMDAFRQFVSFLHTFVPEWLRLLLQPHLGPLPADPAERARLEAPRRAPAPRLIKERHLTSAMNGVTLDSDSDSSDSSRKEPR